MIFKTLKQLLFSDIFKLGNITPKNMEDPTKVANKIADLNITGGDWIAVNGYNSLIAMEGDLVSKKNIVFKPNLGYLVKVFINKTNGEIKLFPATLFERDV